MKILFLVACGISLCFNAFGQPDSARTWQVRWALTSLADPRTPTFQVGLQKNITSKWAFSFDYGLSTYGLLSKKYYPDSVRTSFHYQKLRTELKYLFPVFESAVEGLQYTFYLSVEGVFIPERYNKQMDYFYRDEERYEYSFSRIRNNIYTACLKGGIEWQYNRKWVLDTYAGLGPRFINVQHYDTIPGDLPYTGPQWLAWLSPAPRDRVPGWHNTIHVALGIKLGYYIW